MTELEGKLLWIIFILAFLILILVRLSDESSSPVVRRRKEEDKTTWSFYVERDRSGKMEGERS